jgi:N utilization substance protein A
VASVDSKVDPVGACVGMRGARVKNIVRELNNEKVDIIKWSDDPKEFIVEALKPAKIKSADQGGDDEKYSRDQSAAVTLHRVSDASGKLTSTEVTERPLKKELLEEFNLHTIVFDYYLQTTLKPRDLDRGFSTRWVMLLDVLKGFKDDSIYCKLC